MNKKIEEWLYDQRIEKYIINDDLTVDVHQTVCLSYRTTLKCLPFKFGIINGGFEIYHGWFNTLKNCPNVVKKHFNCADNPNLLSLEHLPVIYGELYCSDNLIDTPEYKRWKLLHNLRK